MESLKICHITPSYPPSIGGLSIVVASICEELAKRGHEVEVLTAMHRRKIVVKNSEKSHDYQNKISVQRYITTSIPFLTQLQFSKKITKYLATKDFDVIHLHSPLILPPKGGYRFYVTMHALVKPWLQRSGHSMSIVSNFRNLDWYTLSVLFTSKIISGFEKKCLSEAEKVICVSKATERDVIELYAEKCNSFEVVYNGLDPSIFVPINLSSETKKKNYVLFAGIFVPIKGIEDILKVAKNLNDIEFVLLGNGPFYNKYKSMKNKLGLDNVLMPGKISRYELLKRYNEAKIFFFPTYYDNCPMSILECMFLGLPIISTTVGGIPELITHEVEGILVPPGDIDAMVKWIQKLMADESLRGRLSKAAKEKANKQLTIEKTVDKLLKLYKK